MFKILDREWKVRKASISGVLQEAKWLEKYGSEFDLPFFWVIEIDTHGVVFDEEYWQPSIEINTLTKPSNWKKFDGFEYTWKEPEGVFCVFGYELIKIGSLTITHKENNAFALELSGQFDVNWDDIYGSDLPFSVSCEAVFTGVTARKQNDESQNIILERLKQFIEVDNIELSTEHEDYLLFSPKI